MQRIIKGVLVSGLLAIATNAAASVILDSGLITVDARGSLNSIGGPGYLDDLLDVPVGATIQSFEMEYLGTESTPGLPLPQSVNVSFRVFTPYYYATSFSFPLAYIGQIVSALPDAGGGVLKGLVSDSEWPFPQIDGTLAWSFGGIDAVATSTFQLRVLGEPAPISIPEPSTLALLAIGIAGLGYSVRKSTICEAVSGR